MTATQSRELAGVVERVQQWPLEMQISLARRFLETAGTPAILEPARTLPLDQVIGILKTEAPAPTDEECERFIEEERVKQSVASRS